MQAVIRVGGKQHRVSEGDVIEVEHLPGDVGSTIVLDQVLAISDGGRLTTDRGELAKVTVKATIQDQFRGEKVVVFKYKKRKGYARTRGHRQQLTRLEIAGIEAPRAAGAKAAPKAEGKGKAAATSTKKAPAKKAHARAAKGAVPKAAAAKEPTATKKSTAAEKTAAAKKPAASKKSTTRKKPTTTKKATAGKKPAEQGQAGRE